MDGDPVPWPQDSSMHLLLFGEPIDDIDPSPKQLVISEVVIEGHLHHPARLENIDCRLSGRDVFPMRRCRAVNQIVIEPEANLVLVGGRLSSRHQSTVSLDLADRQALSSN